MGETLNANTHPIDPIQGRDIFLRMGSPIDAIGSLRNSNEKRYVFRGLVQNFYETEYAKKSKTPFRKEFIEGKIDAFVAYVESKLGSFDPVHSVSFAHGILEFTDKKGTILYNTNAVQLWDNIFKGTPEIKKIEEQTRKETESLRELAMTETLFGGSIIVKYIAIGGSAALGVDSAVNMGRSAIQGQANMYNAYQRVSEILLRTPEGTFERIDLNREAIIKELGSAIAGDRPSLKARTLQITERLGYAFDPIKKTFTHIDRQAFVMASELIQKLSLQELRSRYDLVTVTEEKLIETRKALQEAGKKIDWSRYTRKSLMGILSENVMHAIMWPVFFATFTKRQTNANLVAGMAEWGLFTAGMKVGNKVGKAGGIAGKILAPIILGGAAAGLGHIGFDHLGGSQVKWEHFNGTDMYDYKRSVLMHGLNLGAPEVLDQVNKSRDSSLNAAIPKGNWTELFGKLGRNMPLTAGTGITPEIAFIQSRVNLGVDPAEWMGGSFNNRNKDQWNIEVSRYKLELKKAIFLLIEQFQKNLPPFFAEDNSEQKINLFSQILETHTLNGIGASFYQLERGQIAVMIIAEVQKWQKERSSQNIADVIDNYIAGMYLNDTTFSNEQFRQEGERQSIESKNTIFEKNILNTDEKKYFQSIFARMKNGERLFEADEVESNPFSDRAYRKLSTEHRLFNSILKNKKTISWGPDEKKIEIGKVFANLLDVMSDHVIRRDSMKRLSQISGDENGGYWLESEGIKNLMK